MKSDLHENGRIKIAKHGVLIQFNKANMTTKVPETMMFGIRMLIPGVNAFLYGSSFLMLISMETVTTKRNFRRFVLLFLYDCHKMFATHSLAIVQVHNHLSGNALYW